jgi:phosphosulfolactate synthase (CoM biosynthesis protein A)
MYVGNGYYELLNGKVKLNIEEIQELIKKDTKAFYEHKIEILKKRQKANLEKLKKK